MKFFVTLAVLLAAFSVSVLARTNARVRKFPKNFKFGVATASYQIEGGWNADGKGENIWDNLVHNRPELIADRSTGDVACNSYNLYKRDVEMLVELGVDFYRFSLSWSRILPTGFSDKVNKAGIDYYKKLIAALRANGIEPVITLYHWDLPQPLQELGGWSNPMMVDYFEDFAKVAFEAFGDTVKDWITFNEPVEVCLSGYGRDGKAPALNFSGIGEYLCAHNLLKSHARVYHQYNNNFKPTQKGRVSISFSAGFHEPGSNSTADINAATKEIQFELGWFANPIFSADGDYPRVMKEAIAKRSEEQGFPRSRLPAFTPEEVKYIRGSFDFFGLNHYTSRYTRAVTSNPGHPIPSYSDDVMVESYADDAWETAASDWLKVVPWGFRKLLVWIKDNYNNPELVVFENGFSDDGNLNDLRRINYYQEYLNAMLDAIDEGCFITGYTAWSLMDNFEWRQGYLERFGLYRVDYNSPNRTRTPKASARFYSDVIRDRAI